MHEREDKQEYQESQDRQIVRRRTGVLLTICYGGGGIKYYLILLVLHTLEHFITYNCKVFKILYSNTFMSRRRVREEVLRRGSRVAEAGKGGSMWKNAWQYKAGFKWSWRYVARSCSKHIGMAAFGFTQVSSKIALCIYTRQLWRSVASIRGVLGQHGSMEVWPSIYATRTCQTKARYTWESKIASKCQNFHTQWQLPGLYWSPV